MKTTLRNFAFLAVTAIAASGCTLYFEDDNYSDDRGWGDEGPRDDGWSDDGVYACTEDRDCAAGCYCDEESGVCEEAGFCSTDADCGEGLVCDDRGSCVPGETCQADTDCLAGSFCNEGQCETSCVCETDQDAVDGGYAYCDEDRGTCMPENPAGSCAGAVTCDSRGPACPVGSVATVKDGCYTGNCEVITQCDVAPVCPSFQHEVDCLNPGDTQACGAVYVGRNCTRPDGSSCTGGSGADCTCTSFEYQYCSDQANKTFPNGTPLPNQSYMTE